MKANEAPEKYDAPYRTGAIEYASTDAFIEKACTWLEEHMIGWNNDFVREFRKYIKGE